MKNIEKTLREIALWVSFAGLLYMTCLYYLLYKDYLFSQAQIMVSPYIYSEETYCGKPFEAEDGIYTIKIDDQAGSRSVNVSWNYLFKSESFSMLIQPQVCQN